MTKKDSNNQNYCKRDGLSYRQISHNKLKESLIAESTDQISSHFFDNLLIRIIISGFCIVADYKQKNWKSKSEIVGLFDCVGAGDNIKQFYSQLGISIHKDKVDMKKNMFFKERIFMEKISRLLTLYNF